MELSGGTLDFGSARKGRLRGTGVVDGELMRRVCDGDTSAFDALLKRYERQIIAYLIGMLGDREEALEGAQEVFVRVYTKADKYDGSAPFKAWLYKIATNVGIDLDRKRRRRRWVALGESLFRVGSTSRGEGSETDVGGLSDEPPSRVRGALAELLSAERSAVVRQAIDTLPERYRTALVLRDLQELSYEEIARVLDTRVGTAKSRVNRARNLLRDKLADFVTETGRGAGHGGVR